MEKYSVYVLPDESGNVIAVNSNMFQPDLTGWVKIDEGTGSKYLHAQGNYFDKPIHTELGVCRYRLVDGAVQERSDEEVAAMEAQILAVQEAKPSQQERIAKLEKAVADIPALIQNAIKAALTASTE